MTPREARRAMKSHRTRFILAFTRSDFRRVFGENPFFDSFRLDAHCDGEFELPPPFRSRDSKRQAGTNRMANDLERADQGAVPTDPLSRCRRQAKGGVEPETTVLSH
jgi:hypothetical protein